MGASVGVRCGRRPITRGIQRREAPTDARNVSRRPCLRGLGEEAPPIGAWWGDSPHTHSATRQPSRRRWTVRDDCASSACAVSAIARCSETSHSTATATITIASTIVPQSRPLMTRTLSCGHAVRARQTRERAHMHAHTRARTRTPRTHTTHTTHTRTHTHVR